MIDPVLIERISLWAVWAGIGIAAALMLTIVVGRVAMALTEARQERLRTRYESPIRRALNGDTDALRELTSSPPRDRLLLARLMILPLIVDRDPSRIAATRAIFRALSLVPVAQRFLTSRWWWRRSVALAVIGLIRLKEFAAQVVSALDDPNPEVRNAALDALADLQDPSTLRATVVRLHDATLHRGRRAAAITAFGQACEGFLIDLARVDPEHRLNYARALAICGTATARPTLCEWAGDARTDVRAAAFEALARVGLDDTAGAVALVALDGPDPAVRAMAAGALAGWKRDGDAAARLSAHLADTWPVAVQSARSLREMGDAGRLELERYARRSDLAGTLARQMLWEAGLKR